MNARLVAFSLLFVGKIAFAYCAETANLQVPERLPDFSGCDEKVKTTCYGWEAMGPAIEKDIVSPPGPARLFQWISGDTTCFALIRGKDPNRALSGTHCYNVKTCEVCAYDGTVAGGTKLNQLTPAAAITDDCSRCHGLGPILPGRTIWEQARHATKSLNQLCASLGGPIWLQAPKNWYQRDPKRIVPAPTVSGCINCHQNFIKNEKMCGIYRHSIFEPTGSMYPNRFDLTDPQQRAECADLAKALECSFPCDK